MIEPGEGAASDDDVASDEGTHRYSIVAAREPSGRAIAIAGGVLAAATLPLGPIGAVVTAALTPPTAKMLETAASEWRRQRDESVSNVLTDAAEIGVVSTEGLLEAIGSSPNKLMLLSDVLAAAGRTRLRSKMRALGAALATGALTNDDALIEQSGLRAKILDDLEAPHIQVLQIIADGTTREWPAVYTGVDETTIARSRRGLDGLQDRGLLQPLLRVLDRNGLVYQTGMGEIWDENPADDLREGAGTNEWGVTRFGRSVLEDLRAAGTSDVPPVGG